MNASKVIYSIQFPYRLDDLIEVYGEPEMGWYEWRTIENGKVTKDTQDRAYGNAQIALRDALMYASGLPLPEA